MFLSMEYGYKFKSTLNIIHLILLALFSLSSDQNLGIPWRAEGTCLPCTTLLK